MVGLALAEHRRDRWLWPAAAMIGVVLLAVQISGGAFKAEFTGHPDEAAQFVSGLMVYDYLATLPRENPIAWAGQYYLHYPEVAIGHWPPGYHAMEAVWWLFLGPSRTTAMLLQWLIGVVALTLLYRLCRSQLSLPITAAIIALTIATPVFQQSLEQTMADLCCLLWSVLLMQATVRLVEKQDQTACVAWSGSGCWQRHSPRARRLPRTRADRGTARQRAAHPDFPALAGWPEWAAFSAPPHGTFPWVVSASGAASRSTYHGPAR